MSTSLARHLCKVIPVALCGMMLLGMSPKKVIKMTEEYCYEFPQEKAYVMTDKANYIGGDTIWFRGFVLDAASHQPVKVSRYLYVELCDPFGEVSQRVMVREKDGIYSGYLPLDLDIADGEYQLSAYTNFMRSQRNDYFPKKSLHINNLMALKNEIRLNWDNNTRKLTLNLIDRSSRQPVKHEKLTLLTDGGKVFTPQGKSGDITVKIDPKDLTHGYIKISFDGYNQFIKLDDNEGENYDITFHPEGGYLIPGNECRVAFKAIGKDGYGKEAAGVIIDSLDNKVADFHTFHAGMGSTSFTPEKGQVYTAVNNDGRRFILPLPNETAASIHVERMSNDTLFIDLLGEVPQNGQVVIQQRGIVLWSEPIKDSYSFKFAPSGALSGIMQILLLDKDMNRWSERLVFIDNERVARATISTDRESYGNRKIVWAKAQIDTLKLKKGNFAVSVTDRHSAIIDTMHSIKTQLLLSSDLKGHIENPGFYFSAADSAFRAKALDNLMLTQGWRRYDVPAVLKGHKLTPEFPIEKSMAISGTVKSRWRGKPLKGISLAMISPTTGYGNLTTTDKDGRFEFLNFEYPDSAVYYIQAVNAKGGFEDNIVLDPPSFPDIPYLTSEPQPEGAEHLMDNRMRAELNPMLKSILLSEVVVTENRLKRYSVWYEAVARSRFYPDDPENVIVSTLEDALRSIHGIHLDNNGNITHRGGIIGVFVDGFQILSQGNSTTGSIIPNAPAPKLRKHTKSGTIPGMNSASANSWDFPVTMNATSSMLDEIELMCPYSSIASISFLNSGEAVALGPAASNGALMIRTRDGNGLDAINEHNPHIAIAKPLGYQKAAEFYSPKYEVTDRPDGSDLRSTVYWNPCVRFGDDGKADFEFFTSDNPATSYTIFIEGITDDGRIITGSSQIEIR